MTGRERKRAGGGGCRRASKAQRDRGVVGRQGERAGRGKGREGIRLAGRAETDAGE